MTVCGLRDGGHAHTGNEQSGRSGGNGGARFGCNFHKYFSEWDVARTHRLWADAADKPAFNSFTFETCFGYSREQNYFLQSPGVSINPAPTRQTGPQEHGPGLHRGKPRKGRDL
jgi:hypothetical protein